MLDLMHNDSYLIIVDDIRYLYDNCSITKQHCFNNKKKKVTQISKPLDPKDFPLEHFSCNSNLCRALRSSICSSNSLFSVSAFCLAIISRSNLLLPTQTPFSAASSRAFNFCCTSLCLCMYLSIRLPNFMKA